MLNVDIGRPDMNEIYPQKIKKIKIKGFLKNAVVRPGKRNESLLVAKKHHSLVPSIESTTEKPSTN